MSDKPEPGAFIATENKKIHEMIKKTSEVTSRLSLAYDVTLSRVFATETDYARRNLPFFMNVRKEGIPA